MVDHSPTTPLEDEYMPTKETFKVEKSKTEDGKTLINKRYIVLKRIGEGPFSVVKLCKCAETGKNFAIKQYNKNILAKKKELVRGKDGKTVYRDSLQDVLNEVEMMKKLHHKHIVKLHEVINDPAFHKLYMIIDYCDKSHIMDWSDEKLEFSVRNENNRFSEEEIAKIFS
eukprot:CAMPEP_0114578488 /NCGR_PEP_ID=MMETSP0125-20121206/3020_1 /TAXON_ID=485358 ORGANISM="Aristerostoma sp., Strain ATCC 50986" /NCGR_SAMPLE_ID=MMETSP0125 /ASSEMBLY_ACC=CAM_ASM_000245 /LENGTH=169 /DNA_ID=CAMNT_0001768593 /DNA_START=21 /DNA_END=530 /DNA_ORIENTATION=-